MKILTRCDGSSRYSHFLVFRVFPDEGWGQGPPHQVRGVVPWERAQTSLQFPVLFLICPLPKPSTARTRLMSSILEEMLAAWHLGNACFRVIQSQQRGSGTYRRQFPPVYLPLSVWPRGWVTSESVVPRPEGAPHVSSHPANETDMPTRAERLAGLPSDSVSLPFFFLTFIIIVYIWWGCVHAP